MTTELSKFGEDLKQNKTKTCYFQTTWQNLTSGYFPSSAAVGGPGFILGGVSPVSSPGSWAAGDGHAGSLFYSLLLAGPVLVLLEKTELERNRVKTAWLRV